MRAKMGDSREMHVIRVNEGGTLNFTHNCLLLQVEVT